MKAFGMQGPPKILRRAAMSARVMSVCLVYLKYGEQPKDQDIPDILRER